jgi:hypothetical protein
MRGGQQLSCGRSVAIAIARLQLTGLLARRIVPLLL